MAVDAVFVSPSSTAISLSAVPGQETADFLLHPAEIAKGRVAVERALETLKSDDACSLFEEALCTLAVVLTDGLHETIDFPWHQVRAYHSAAAFAMLRQPGAPARIEALLCQRNDTRKFRAVQETYPNRQIQKIRTTLARVIKECAALGYVTEEDGSAAIASPKAAKSTGRLLADGEFRALVASCQTGGTGKGLRDALLFSLAYHGLKNAELFGLTVDCLNFSSKTGACMIVVKPAKAGGRGRRVKLSNEEMIRLEDWLEYRGRESGPLLCDIGRSGKIELKRMTTASLKEVCEARAALAELEPFAPNDMHHSIEALDEQKRAVRERSSKLAALDRPSSALFEDDEDDRRDPIDEVHAEAIHFPFGGLGA